MNRLKSLVLFTVFLSLNCTTQNPIGTPDKGAGDGQVKDITVVDNGGVDQGLPPWDGPNPWPDLALPPDYLVPPPDKALPPPDQYIPLPDQGTPPDIGPVKNNTCSTAAKLSWTGTKISVSGSTVGMSNEYGTAINCGTLTTIYSGQQVYYKVDLVGSKTYRFQLAPKFHLARLYIFTGCGSAQINKDCGSKGQSGDTSANINNGYTGSVIFKAPKSGTYYVAVDSTNPSYAGSFSLTVEPYTMPGNVTCTKAQILSLSSGTVTVTGSTEGIPNEFGSGINCKHNYYTYPGSQLYYKVWMSAGKTYRVTLSPSYYASMYLFRTNCTPSAINTDCGSGGASGAVLPYIYKGQNGVILFKPAKAGYFTIAVDGRYTTSYYSGSFTLTVEDYKAPGNSTCKNATTLKLSSGKVSVSGTTSGVPNEFSITCGKSYAMNGPQVYYKVALTKGKSYKISLKPEFHGYFYVFTNTCSPTQINGDCGSGGKTGDLSNQVYKGNTGSLIFTPTVNDTFTIAVDSYSTSSYYQGKFTLSIEEYKMSTNGTCAKATKLALSKGKVSVKGDTLGVPNEFGSQIDCGWNSYYNYVGSQVYYDIPLTKGKTYKLALTPTFYAALYIFSNTCNATQIDADCGSGGKTGAYTMASANQTKTLLFTPPATGTYKIAVDSYLANYAGAFTLDISEFSTPKNGVCKSPQTLTLSGGTATIQGDTTGAANEFGTAINCGNLYYIFRGNQVYYSVALTKGKTYTLTLTPSFNLGRFYVFRAGCDPNKINGDCGSAGSTGLVSGNGYPTNPTTMTFTPTVSAPYVIAVDTTYVQYYGAFTLVIK